jgi:hypothetical protein
MLQPKRADVSPDGDAGIDIIQRGMHGFFAGAVHDHDKFGFLKNDFCCILKGNDFFVFIGYDPQVLIESEYF